MELGVRHGWFAEEGLQVEIVYYTDNSVGIEEFKKGTYDAICLANSEQLALSAAGHPSRAVVITDFSNGGDLLIGNPGIKTAADLRGKKIAVEFRLSGHLLLGYVLKQNGMTLDDVQLVNTPNSACAGALMRNEVAAISGWNPELATALHLAKGSSVIYSTADAPGIVYDIVCASPSSVAARRGDWIKFIRVWNRIARYVNDRKNLREVLDVVGEHTQTDRQDLILTLPGIYILTPEEALNRFRLTNGLGSLFGSNQITNEFNISLGLYSAGEAPPLESMQDGSLLAEVLESSAD